jgi:hypothetical protein
VDARLLGLGRRGLCLPPLLGLHVGFYGGVNYGFGYDGDGFHGGLWEGEHFAYSATVMNVNCPMVRNTFNNVGISQSLRPGGFGQLMALRWIFGQLMVFFNTDSVLKTKRIAWPAHGVFAQQMLSLAGGVMKTWVRLLLVLAAVGGGCSGIVATLPLLSGLPTQGLCYAVLTLIAFAVYSALTASGLLFAYDGRVTRPMLFAFALQIPWVDLPGFRYQAYSLLYTAITFGPPQGNGRV